MFEKIKEGFGLGIGIVLGASVLTTIAKAMINKEEKTDDKED